MKNTLRTARFLAGGKRIRMVLLSLRLGRARRGTAARINPLRPSK